MENNQQQIIELISTNILNEILSIDTSSTEFSFVVEKILINCGLDEKYIPEFIFILKQSLNNTTKVKNEIIKTHVNEFVDAIFEERKKIDKIAVRNKKSGAIQLVSKKTYQSNSQIYTPLSAGWAKANVIMVRNKTSGEEYPVLLKNFDSNKHEKVGTATEPEDKDEEEPLKVKPITPQQKNTDKKSKEEEPVKKSSDTVRPIMVEPSLKAKTMTAFITPKDVKPATGKPEYPENEDDIIRTVNKAIKDKKLNKKIPTETPSYKYTSDESDYEIYDKLGSAGLLPSGFNLNKKYTIPNSLINKVKIPRGYITLIEQLINTIRGTDTSITSYSIPFAIKTNPNAMISLFELLLLYSVTLDKEEFSKFSISIETFINTGIESNLTIQLWETVVAERDLIINYLKKKYSSTYNIVAGSWKTEDHQLDLGVDDSDIDMEKISDIFLRVNTNTENDFLEEFLVTPNESALINLNKTEFLKYIKIKKENAKVKILMFILKIFPLQDILDNKLTVVFPAVIYDQLTLSEFFKTRSIENIGLKLNYSDKKIDLTYKTETQNGTVLSIIISDIISIKINESFKNKCIQFNKKIYKAH